MFHEMRLFIGCCVNQEHCWTCHFLLSWQALLGNGRTLLFIRPRSTARGVCQTRSTMQTLVTFVQLVLCWYNGFSQSVVMESDWVPENTCVGERGHMPQYCEKADCQQKSDCSLMDTCSGIKTMSLFFMNAWLSPANKHMAETRTSVAVPDRHTQRNRHTSRPRSVWLLFWSVYDLKPHCWIKRGERWVAGVTVPGLRWSGRRKSPNTN